MIGGSSWGQFRWNGFTFLYLSGCDLNPAIVSEIGCFRPSMGVWRVFFLVSLQSCVFRRLRTYRECGRRLGPRSSPIFCDELSGLVIGVGTTKQTIFGKREEVHICGKALTCRGRSGSGARPFGREGLPWGKVGRDCSIGDMLWLVHGSRSYFDFRGLRAA